MRAIFGTDTSDEWRSGPRLLVAIPQVRLALEGGQGRPVQAVRRVEPSDQRLRGAGVDIFNSIDHVIT